MKILLINGTIVGEKTKVLLNEAKKHLIEYIPENEIQTIHLEDYQMEFANGRLKSEYNEDTSRLIDEMESADGYIVATPVFQGSIPGVLKNLFDLISPKAMRYKPIAIMANGGTFQHHLAVVNQLKPILDYFRSLMTPNYVYTHTNHFSHTNEIIDEDVIMRIKELTRVLYKYLDISHDILDGYDFNHSNL
ncbi:NADPH-dependent FMN reductase [Tenuibacillus multivorans]|uniref:FMN reductase n=1 Tax=Tenuibacillus multivorans TaxID=237069 RepID=A0A1H0B7S9_9BACI|nr:NAD(P)H-dependent oxidoreductase [Tenuibacillus multivorans]GEL78608.1 FMN reductase [Tenuibacillus multivorans]SDN41740.1 FMN reductase [Tenuibacillus multivorans]